MAGLSIILTTAKLGGSQWGLDLSCWAAAPASAAAADDDGDDDNNKETFKFYCTFPVVGHRPWAVGRSVGGSAIDNPETTTTSCPSTGPVKLSFKAPTLSALWFSGSSLSHLPPQHHLGLVHIICLCRSWLSHFSSTNWGQNLYFRVKCI